MSTDTTLADVQPGGRVRLGDTDPMRSALEDALQFVETLHSTVSGDSRKIVWRCLERGRAALAARQPVYVQGSDELRARTEGERAAYMEGLEEGKKIAARQAVGQIDEAAVLRRAAAVLDMWEGDSNQTGYMGDFKDAQAILEVLAQNAAPTAQAVDLGQSIPSELAPVAAALKRFGDCAEDSGSEGCDIGRDWFDALTTIGLLSRTQRSPAVWTMTAEGERLLALIDSQAVGK